MHCIVSKEGSIVLVSRVNILIYGTETWAIKADDLKSLKKRWMCGVSLKDRKPSELVRIYATFLVLTVLLKW